MDQPVRVWVGTVEKKASVALRVDRSPEVNRRFGIVCVFGDIDADRYEPK